MMAAAETDLGIVRIPSRYSVAETIDRLTSFLQQRGITVFARIDFSGDAARAGLTLRAEQMLIFGNPRAGTPLLVAAPTVGLDLPMKALIWEDLNGEVWLGYNDPTYIVNRHRLESSFTANLEAVVPLMHHAASE
jgi:uncharacterized protein (DUF302 family)